jgi:shikimate dehydrogenase
MNITAATRGFALLGDPVAHSLSPLLHNAAFRETARDAVYLALPCTAQRLPGLLRGLAAAGGGGNVTAPHKAAAAALLDSATAAVSRTGACNTFWNDAGMVRGDNTDIAGCTAALRALVDTVAGARVLVLGAGGAAAAMVCALLDERADRVELLNRSAGRGLALLDRLAEPAQRVRLAADDAAATAFDLIVNATPLGMHAGDAMPLPLESGPGAVLDLVYGPGETEWVRSARQLGIPAADGREMLVMQAAASFERWFAEPAPIIAMRAALAATASGTTGVTPVASVG